MAQLVVPTFRPDDETVLPAAVPFGGLRHRLARALDSFDHKSMLVSVSKINEICSALAAAGVRATVPVIDLG